MNSTAQGDGADRRGMSPTGASTQGVRRRPGKPEAGQWLTCRAVHLAIPHSAARATAAHGRCRRKNESKYSAPDAPWLRTTTVAVTSPAGAAAAVTRTS